ncbi:hypothetical protein LCGC14_3098600 [marine sediment metagenome]|uniref:Uncharacterized protein n=1 Tax=marine sediment metagenome TaxID=412755 RepID=A0A0F8WX92_9ZZZZ
MKTECGDKVVKYSKVITITATREDGEVLGEYNIFTDGVAIVEMKGIDPEEYPLDVRSQLQEAMDSIQDMFDRGVI